MIEMGYYLQGNVSFQKRKGGYFDVSYIAFTRDDIVKTHKVMIIPGYISIPGLLKQEHKTRRLAVFESDRIVEILPVVYPFAPTTM